MMTEQSKSKTAQSLDQKSPRQLTCEELEGQWVDGIRLVRKRKSVPNFCPFGCMEKGVHWIHTQPKLVKALIGQPSSEFAPSSSTDVLEPRTTTTGDYSRRVDYKDLN